MGITYVKNILNPFDQVISGRRQLCQVLNNLLYSHSPLLTRVVHRPIDLILSITDRCTLACDMCLVHSTKLMNGGYLRKMVPDMPWDMFCDIICRFKQAQSLSFTGTGEPMLHSDFFRMVEHATTHKLDVHASSNGTTVERNILTILNSKLKSLNISVNGYDQNEFHRITGLPTHIYGKIINAVHNLTKRKRQLGKGPLISVSFIIDQHNCPHVQRMINLAFSLGAEVCSLNNILPFDVPGFRAAERCIFDDDLEARDIFERIRSHGDRMVCPPRPFPRQPIHHYCKAPFRSLQINGNGDTDACAIAFPQLGGNGKYTDANVWNSSHFREKRRLLIEKRQLPALCRTCQVNVPHDG